MSEGIDKQNIVLEIETEKENINSFLDESFSNREKLIKLSNFFDKIISTGNTSLINAFLPEFIQQYTNLLSQYEPYYLSPSTSIKIIEIANKIICFKNEYLNVAVISNHIIKIEKKLKSLENILNGTNVSTQSRLTFPVLENYSQSLERYSFGLLESLTIQIRKSKSETKFLVIPSESHLEQKITMQINDSWANAIDYLRNNKIKILHKHYEVLIAFDQKEGIIIGNSLGVVLTIAFIEELLKYYNTSLVIDAKDNIAITGGLDENGKIINASREIIRIKTETIFYSAIQTFCVPKVNELTAEEKLEELKKEYPNRNLEIVGLTSLNDLLNRRNIVEISKQKLIVKTGKFIKKNWLSAVTTLLLSILFAYLFVMDFDDNPNSYSLDGRKVYIKNKKGRILWEQPLNTSNEVLQNPVVQAGQIRIINVDNDKMNEVLFIPTSSDDVKRIEGGTELICFTYDQKIKWRYSFYDKIHSIREDIDTIYSIRLFDTLTVEKSKRLFLLVNNIHSFPSAIISLDLNTGKRLNGTIWMSGATGAGLIKDINNDNQPDIIALGWDNGYEDICLFGFELNNNEVVRPSTKTYQILDYPIATHLFCVRVPKTDFDNYYEHRTPGLGSDLLYNNYEPSVNFMVGSVSDKTTAGYGISFDKNFLVKRINIANDFRVRRDTLVAHGKLKPPYTDTEEYKEIIKDNILYWKDGKWVNRKGIEKK